MPHREIAEGDVVYVRARVLQRAGDALQVEIADFPKFVMTCWVPASCAMDRLMGGDGDIRFLRATLLVHAGDALRVDFGGGRPSWVPGLECAKLKDLDRLRELPTRDLAPV